MKIDNEIYRSVVLVSSWLEYFKVSHTIDLRQGWLLVKNKAGADCLVTIGSAQEPANSDFHLVSSEIIGRRSQNAVSIIRRLINSLGVETPDSAFRPQFGRIRDDFHLTYLRHSEFSKCPNLSEAVYRHYAPMIRKICNHTFNKNFSAFRAVQMEVSDLETCAFVFTTSFMALHRRPDRSQSENDKLWCYNVQQRLCLLARKVSAEYSKSEDGFRTLKDAEHSENVRRKMNAFANIEAPTMSIASTIDMKDLSRFIHTESALPYTQEEVDEMSHDEFINMLVTCKKKSNGAIAKEATERRQLHNMNCKKCTEANRMKRTGSVSVPHGTAEINNQAA